MRKLAFVLAIIIVLSAPTSVCAESVMNISKSCTLTISGTTATCAVRIRTENTSDEIDISVSLYRDNMCVNTWVATGNGSVYFNKTHPATSGYTYRMTVYYKINGVAQPLITCTPS